MCRTTSSNKSVLSKLFPTADRIVPTFPIETAHQQLNITHLTSSDLAALKRNDPFMYYSIPSVKNVALNCKDVNASLLNVPSSRHSHCSEVKSKENASTKCTVTRQRRLSVECHPDVLMEALLADSDVMSSLKQVESGNDDEDELYDFLFALHETAR
ncbi:hypothetical protein ACHAW6_000597 [Cyclotella cf. meneghiniana]